MWVAHLVFLQNLIATPSHFLAFHEPCSRRVVLHPSTHFCVVHGLFDKQQENRIFYRDYSDGVG